DDAGVAVDSGIDCTDPAFERTPACLPPPPPSDCDIFTGGCDPDYACYPPAAGDTAGFCQGGDPSPRLGRGGPCTDSSYPRAPGLICNAEAAGVAGQCMPYCDATHACLAGEDCFMPDPSFVFGVCRGSVPPPPPPPPPTCDPLTQERCDAPSTCVLRGL